MSVDRIAGRFRLGMIPGHAAGLLIVVTCGRQPYPAQQESFATSFVKPRAASFSPSTVVR